MTDRHDGTPPSQRRGRRLLGVGARTIARRMGRFVGSTRASDWERIGEDWFKTLSDLRGAAMKLGQIASQYADLLPPALAEQLVRLQASAQPVAWSHVESWLRSRWSSHQWALIDAIDEDAIGVASIGQVHHARLVDGTEVAIKVQYPGVAEAIDRDVRNLGRLLRMGRLLPLEPERLDALLEEVRDRLREEVDYTGEAARHDRFRLPAARFNIVVPEVIHALQTDTVLVTRYEPGESLSQARQWPQDLRDQMGAQLRDWTFYQIRELAEVHADPHPGNYAFRHDGTVVQYDFGCTRSIDPRFIAHFRKVVGLARRRDYHGLHAELGEMGSLSKPEREAGPRLVELYAACNAELMHAIESDTFDFSETDIIENLRAIAQDNMRLWPAFQPIPELAFVARALSGTYWLLRGLGARVALTQAFDEFAT